MYFKLGKMHEKRHIVNIVDTINGTEAQSKTSKYEYLPLLLDKSIYRISVMSVDRYVPLTVVKGT